MTLAPLLSSAKQDWRTPRALFEAISRMAGGFDLDAAADAENHLCDRWLGDGGEAADALAVPWRAGRVWLNPPYGRALPQFCGAARHEVIQGHCAEVWLLVPARVDTRWWNHMMPHAKQVWFYRGRVKFETATGALNAAPFPTALVRLVRQIVPVPAVSFGWRP